MRAGGIRLHTRIVGDKVPSPPPPFALWSSVSDDVAVWLEAATNGVIEVGEVAAQLPDPSTLHPGKRVFILEDAARRRRRWPLWPRRRRVVVSRAVRCTAFVVRGYVRIAAATDDSGRDLVWAHVPEELAAPSPAGSS